MTPRTLLALVAALLCVPISPPPAAAQSSASCQPNYARVSQMQGLLHWNHFPLRIAFVPAPADMPSQDVNVEAVLAGFTQWADATRGLVRFSVVPQTKDADVVVSFVSQANVPGQGAAVGYTSMMYCGTALRRAEMMIATGGTTPGDLQAVAAHEFGHALGIDGHSDSPDDIMYPSTLRMTSEDGAPAISPLHPVTTRDLNTLKACYPDLFASHVAARPELAFEPSRTGAAVLGAHRHAFHGFSLHHWPHG